MGAQVEEATTKTDSCHRVRWEDRLVEEINHSWLLRFHGRVVRQSLEGVDMGIVVVVEPVPGKDCRRALLLEGGDLGFLAVLEE